jgi:hypothetical protein
MAFDRQGGGHNFDFSSEACTKCGMSREHYEDNGKPRCKGKPEPSRPKEHILVPEDE